MSSEIKLLILAINVAFQKTNLDSFRKILNDPTLDWLRVEKLLAYHEIIQVFYHACIIVGYSNKYVEDYGQFSKILAVKNTIYKKECIEILHLFKEEKIKAIPYKGILFLNKLYGDRSLRTMMDIDILVNANQGAEALKLLTEKGYSIIGTDDYSISSLQKLIDTIPNQEIPLTRVDQSGTKIIVDFHWNISLSKQYNIDIEQLLNMVNDETWNSTVLPTPNSESILIMIMNHHGGRECWRKLKYIVDLWAYLEAFQNVPIHQTSKICKNISMNQIYNYGLWFVNQVFEENRPIDLSIRKEVISNIHKLWEIGKNVDSLRPKIILLFVYRKVQDMKMSWNQLIKDGLEFHSRTGLNQTKRIVNFPERFTYLNAFSKLLGYLFKRLNKKIFLVVVH